jgi:LuxR family transcriptional regulator, regulator of acetate metabolism
MSTASIADPLRSAYPSVVTRSPVQLHAVNAASRAEDDAHRVASVALADRRAAARLLAVQRELLGALTIPDLFGRASELAPAHCGFARALLASVSGGTLCCDATPALSDPRADRLRRAVLANPLHLRAGTAEAEFIRLAEGGRGETSEGDSVLRAELGVSDFALGAVIPDDRVLALLIVERDDRPVAAADRAAVQGFAQLISWAVERQIMRQRMSEVAAELRYAATSSLAMIEEGCAAPLALPVDYGAGPVFARGGAPMPASRGEFRELFTRREWSIAREIVAGKSNREIAASLHLSPETVKSYVSRILRKLGATSRADAAVRFLRACDG